MGITNKDVLKTVLKVPQLEEQLEENVRLLENNYPIIKNVNTLNHIMLGMDSLTNGAGGSSYVDYFRDKLHAILGYGGGGYLPLEYQTLVNETEYFSMGFTDSSGFGYISNLTDINNPSVKYSFDNKGIFVENTQNSYVEIFAKTKCDNIKLIYLQQPSGGTFQVGYKKSSNKINVDTNGAFEIKVIELPKNNVEFNGEIMVSPCNGKLTLYGIYTYNDSGCIISRFGQGGQLLTKIVKDSEVLNKWLSILQPTLLMLDSGTNDGGSQLYKDKLDVITQAFIDNNSEVVLIRPHLMDKFWSCEPYLFQVAKEKKLPVLNIKNLFGNTFEQSQINGYMLDGVHPNTLGNIKKANRFLDYLGVPKIAKKIDKNFGVQVCKPLVLSQDLKKLLCNGHSTQEQTTKIYEIGLVGAGGVNIVQAVCSVEVTGKITDNSFKIKKYTIAINNKTSNNNYAIAETNSLKSSIIYDNSDFDFDVIFENINNRVNVKVKTNSPYWVKYNICANVKILESYNNIGEQVIEN